MPEKRRRRSRHRFDRIPNLPDSGDIRGFHSRTEANLSQRMTSERVPPTHAHDPLLTSPQPVTNDAPFAIMAEGSNDGFPYNLQHTHSSLNDAESVTNSTTRNFEHTELTRNINTPAESPSGSEEDSPIRISSWRVLWALLMTCGSRRLTKNQYQSVRMLSEFMVLEGSGDWKQKDNEETVNVGEATGSCLPHYSTLYKSVKPHLFKSLTVRKFDHFEPVNLRKAGACSQRLPSSGDPVVCVRTVLPSEYARADLATPQVYDAMRRTSLSFHQERGLASRVPGNCGIDCIDLVPVIASREWFFGEPTSISIEKSEADDSSTYFAESGDVVRFTLMTNDALDSSFSRCFGLPGDVRDVGLPKAQGKIVSVWPVRHSSRRNDSAGSQSSPSGMSLSQRDQCLRDMFGFVSYTSPTDSISVLVPDLPRAEEYENDAEQDQAEVSRRRAELSEARKQRRNALRDRSRQIEDAWANWVKPLIKPGDVISLLCPHRESNRGEEDASQLTCNEQQSRVLIIHRHWTENEERSVHMIWVPGDIDLGSGRRSEDLSSFCKLPILASVSSTLYMHIRELNLLKAHPGERGPQAFPAVSSFGTLSTGELYCVYRFVLFWDGFEVQTGSEASGDGVYILCLNFPSTANRCPNDIRIISLTPPGVKSDAVLRAIISDVVKGMTEGFLDVDADGNMRRIFLDLVGFVGDTPALNAFLDVLGHTSCAFCHLCRFIRRSATIVGSRYTANVPQGVRTSSKRGFYQEQAIRDCAPGPETCRLLGLKYQPDDTATVLHHVGSQLHTARERIPRTVYGHPVVPCVVDPYRACIIAPDHLLSSHGRDCINLALQCLPTRLSREVCEKNFLELLQRCNLSTQNRVVNHEKKKLFAMSMSELYSLILVAHHAFIIAVQNSSAWSNCSVVQREKLTKAIAIVASVANVVAALWFKPDDKKDSTADVELFKADGGNKYFIQMRTVVDRHIALVEEICTMPDENALNLSNSSFDRIRRAELARERVLCDMARRTIDKPNVHRLRELVYETLPMFGHISIFAELPLEKTHQQLKRAIRISNQKNAHIQAMDSAIFQDWQGRLTMVAPLAAQLSERYILAFYRLISGRESVISMKGRLLDRQKHFVQGCLSGCIRKELSTQGHLVLSRRLINFPLKRKWALRNEHTVPQTLVLNPADSSASQKEALLAVQRIFQERMRYGTLKRSNCVTTSISTGIPGHSISVGDVIEILTLQTTYLTSHYPFMLQSNVSKTMNRAHSPTLWLAEGFFSITDKSSVERVFAAVRPIVTVLGELSTDRNAYKLEQGANLTIAEMDASIRRVPVVRKDSNTFFLLTRTGGYPPRQG